MSENDKLQYEKLLPKFNTKTLTKQEAVSFMRLARIAEQEKFNDMMAAADRQPANGAAGQNKENT